MRLGKDPFTVVGVAPARFHGTERFVWPDYWIPVVNHVDAEYLQNRTGHPLTVLGRLKPGVTPEQAAEDLSAIAAQLAKEYPKTDTGVPLRLIRPGLYADARRRHPRISLWRDRAGSAGAGGGVRESGQPVCGARGGSQPGTGAPCRPGSEPVAAGAATADGGDGVVDARRSRGDW